MTGRRRQTGGPTAGRLGPAALLIALALGASAGCSDGASSPDGGTDGGVDAGAASAAETRIARPPEPLVPPELLPCPEGWVPRWVEPEVLQCHPWSEPPPDLGCDFAEIHVPGEDGCQLVGASCPADGWPAGLPSDGTVIHVRAGASGGDGSREQPYGSIGTALDEAGAGDVVAVAVGEYDESIEIPAGVEVRGACPSETRLTSSVAAAPPAAVIETSASDAVVRDLAVTYASRAGVYVAPGGSLTLRGVLIVGVDSAGIAVLGDLDAEGLAVRSAGRGISVEGGGRATVRRAVFAENEEVGLYSSAELHVQDAVVRGFREGFDLPGFGGPGLSVEMGGSAELQRTVVQDNPRAGAMALDDSSLTLRDVVLRDNDEEAVRIYRGGSVSLRRVAIAPHSVALLGSGEDIHIVAEDAIFHGGIHRGVSVSGDVELELRRVLVTDSNDVGVMMHGEGTTLAGEDLWIRRTRGHPDDGSAGRGLNVQSGAQAEITRARIEDNRDHGVFVSGAGSRLVLRDAVIRDTHGRESDGRQGSAVVVQQGAVGTIERAELERNRGVALFAIGEGTELAASDTLVRETRPHECAGTSCTEMPAGVGVGAYVGARLRAEAFDVLGSPLCGVQVAAAGRLALSGGRVADNAIGACIQIEGYDLELLRSSVEYRSNEINLDTTELPIPDPQPTIEP